MSQQRHSLSGGISTPAGFLSLILLIVTFSFNLFAATTSGPLRVSPANPRYFADGTGKIVLLTGSHTWASLQDYGTASPAPVFDFNGYLNILAQNNHNFLRLWAWENTRWAPWTSGDFNYSPSPYARPGPGTAADGAAKFDLTQFNQAYFDRLRTRVIAARDRGIYVSVMLFQGWSIETKISGGNNPWLAHPFRAANNVNGINGDPNGDGQGTEVHTLAVPAMTALQEAYVRKVVDTVNDLDNVLYEVANESGSYSLAWQYHIINYLKTYQASKPRKHPVGITYIWGLGNTELFNSPADWISPNGIGNIDGYMDNPRLATGNKVVLTDTDHIWGKGGDGVWVWKSFARGLQCLYMDGNLMDGTMSTGGPNTQSARRAMGDTLRYASKMNLASMPPRNDLASTAYCLANAASEFLVYQPLGGAFTVNFSGVTGDLTVEWLNPVTSAVTAGGVIAGGATRTLTPPFSGPAVVYLKATSGGITPPPPVTGQPDLTVTSFTISPSAPLAGQPVVFTATVKNQGDAAVPAGTSIGLGFFVDVGAPFSSPGSARAWSATTAGLAAGASVTLTSTAGPEAGIWTALLGVHQIAVHVDDLGGIAESNDGNNVMLFPVTVTAGPAPPTPTVTVAAADPQATEPANAPAPNAAPDTGSFVITRTGDLSTALTVTYTLSGSANNGVDYNPLGNTVTIPAGSASVTLTVTPINDTVVEPAKTVTLHVISTANYTVGATAQATVTIIDNDVAPPPVTGQPDLIVTAFSISPVAPQVGQPVTFTATIKNQGTAATSARIGLGFYVDAGTPFGTAGSPKAWTSLANLAPGQSATVTSDAGPEKGVWTTTVGTHQVAVHVDDLNGIAESSDANNVSRRTLTVVTTPGVTNPPPAGIADLAITNLTASLLYPVEGSPLIFRAWVRNQGTASTPATNLHVLFYLDDTEAVTWSGIVAPLRPGETRIITASGGLNQTNRSNRSAWIAQPGAHKITAAIDIANHIVESNETNNTCSLNLLIPHLTAPLVSATSPRYSTTSEGTNGVRLFTFTRRGATNDDLLVRFAVGGTARSGDDFEPLAGEVIIPAGATQATVQYTPVDDDTVEPMETLSLTLLPSLDYKVNRYSVTARLLIYDNDRDTDRDGVTDRLEILAGTNPRDPLSH